MKFQKALVFVLIGMVAVCRSNDQDDKDDASCVKLSCKKMGESCGLKPNKLRKCGDATAYCTGSYSGVCKGFGDEGDPCDGNCKHGLECLSDRCHRKGALGEKCDKNDDCISGYCEDYKCVSGFSNDESCTYHSDCLSGYCNSSDVCAEKVPNGEECDNDKECKSDLCNETNWPYTCADKLSDGENCTGDKYCKSGHCYGEIGNKRCKTIVEGDNCSDNSDCSSIGKYSWEYECKTDENGTQTCQKYGKVPYNETCSKTMDCVNGHYCNTTIGKCMPVFGGKLDIECRNSTQCPEGTTCACNYKKGKRKCQRYLSSEETVEIVKEFSDFGEEYGKKEVPSDEDYETYAMLSTKYNAAVRGRLYDPDFFPFCSTGTTLRSLPLLVVAILVAFH